MRKVTIVMAWLLTACLLLSMVACSTEGGNSTTPTTTTTANGVGDNAEGTTTGGDETANTTTVAGQTTTTKKPTTTVAGQTTTTKKPTTTVEGQTTTKPTVAPTTKPTVAPTTDPVVTPTTTKPTTKVTTTTTKKPTTTKVTTTTTKKPTTTKVTTTTTKKPTTTKVTTTTTKKPTTTKVTTTTTKKPTTTTTTKPTTKVTTTTTTKPTTTTTTRNPSTIPPAINDGVHLNFRNSTGTIGVWWWSGGDANNANTRSTYLKFLYDNQVSEIYLCADGMNDAQKATFIREAGTYGMRVAWLSGDASWINSQNTSIASRYITYQNQAAADAKFYALHLDVEPHQLGEFSSNRASVMQKYANYVQNVATMMHNAGQKIEWDIPFWMESDNVTIGGRTVSLLDHVASVSDTICIMSYRDTSTAIVNVSSQEITAAKNNGCKVICGVETYSVEGDQVSFGEEGKREIVSQLGTVYNYLGTRGVEYGVAVHHMSQWYNLKNG